MLIKNSDRIDQENQLDEEYVISAHYHFALHFEPDRSDEILEVASPRHI
jgi:hypothetical protein